MGQVFKAVCHCMKCHFEAVFDHPVGWEIISDGRHEENLCGNCWKNTCEWCLQVTLGPKDEPKFNPVFANCIDRSMGGGYHYICRNCLIALVNQEIEDIRQNAYEGVELLDHDDPKSGSRERLELQVLRDLCFLGLA